MMLREQWFESVSVSRVTTLALSLVGRAYLYPEQGVPYEPSLHEPSLRIEILEKALNDIYGHQIGDVVLVETGRRLKQVFREIDYLIRWGGEEF